MGAPRHRGDVPGRGARRGVTCRVLTPADFRRLADQADAESLQLALAGDFFKAADKALEAERLRYTADQLEARLKGTKGRAILEANMAQVVPEPRRRGRPTKSRHPFPVALEARGTNVAEWAREHGYERAVVKSWFSPKPNGRSIPRAAAQLIERELGVPATDLVWVNGIR